MATALARSVHTGAALPTALADAASTIGPPAAGELGLVCEGIARGVPVVDALRAWSDRCPSDGVRLLVGAARAGHEHGGRLGPALDGVAMTLHDRVEVADEARALSSQARTSAVALVALPPFGALCFSLLDPSVLHTLAATPLGWACVVVGGGLDLLGAWVMRRMVASAVPS